MDKLRVRVYNVLFGDAILVSVPDRGPNGETRTRHILIDVGNLSAGPGSRDSVFTPVVNDILEELDHRPLDLYVMTHEHMDHVQGLPYTAAKEPDLLGKLRVQHAWLTASAEKNYYDKNPAAKRLRLHAMNIYSLASNFLAASGERNSFITALMMNNDPRVREECVKFLRNLAKPGRTWYMHRPSSRRGFNLDGRHTFHETRFEIWAPEYDVSVYYGKLQSMTLCLRPEEEGKPTPGLPDKPDGVDEDAFYHLLEVRRHGYIENILALDKVSNNTSMVFSLEWRGWRLLFTGDAETESWEKMDEKKMLKPVHFLKVSHHGSLNGTPYAELLDKILPRAPPDNRRRTVVVSTCPGTVYKSVPDGNTLARLRRRCDELYRTDAPNDLTGPYWVDVEFPEGG